MTDEQKSSDLCYGAQPIAEHLGLTPAKIYHLVRKGALPTFRIAGVICARRSTLAAWLAEKEAEGEVARQERAEKEAEKAAKDAAEKAAEAEADDSAPRRRRRRRERTPRLA